MLTIQEIEQKIKEIIADQLGRDVSEIGSTDHLIKDLGADSLDSVEVVMALEDSFPISIGDDQLNDLNTVADLVELVRTNIQNQTQQSG